MTSRSSAAVTVEGAGIARTRVPAALVLAAGGSTRMGRPKQLLDVGGVPLLTRAVTAACDAGCDPVVVVVGRDAASCRNALHDRLVAKGPGPVVRLVENADWAAGQGSSLRAGVRALAADTASAFVLLCDQPYVSADVLTRLNAARRATGRPVCVAGYAGTVGPPVLVGTNYLVRLRDWPDDRGAKVLWTSNPQDVQVVDCPEAATDVDTPEDYCRLIDAPAADGPG